MLVCASCSAANAEGSKFCEDCGAPLEATCPSCGAPVNPTKRFCRSCGAPLAAASAGPGADGRAVPPAAPTTVAAPRAAGAARVAPLPVPDRVAERRLCSMLFVDLVGFTPLTEGRDPEEVRELLSRYFERARTIVDRYGGVVEKFIGDAVMAVWGTPVATEEDSERAVRAALDLVDAVAVLGRQAGLDGLAARAGVVTGPVAVTIGAAGEGMVAGDAVNTAARVQSVAEPGAVLVDEETWRQAQAAIDLTPWGDRLLKGKALPVRLWRAERVLSGVGGAQRIDGLEAPFVGRDTELRLVKDLFHACAERRATRLVSVTGVPGVGKSRLVWEFEKYIDGLAATVLWHRGRCLSYGDGVAFWALAEMVRQRFGIAEEDSSSVAAAKLADQLPRWLGDPSERAYVGPRLAQLLGVVYGEPGPVLGQDELFAGWRLFFERLAATAPVVMVVEDLHRADPGLLDFLEHLLDWARDAPVFVLTTARSEVEALRPGWGTGRRNTTSLALDGLDDQAMDAVLQALVPGMPAPARDAVAAHAEGIPLYAVETVRMLIDHDVVQPKDGVYRLVGDVGELRVPTTLHSLLAARLDALEPAARALVADAAVLGGSFSARSLVAVTGRPESEVRALLAELVQREVLAVRADKLSPQQGHYGFVQTMYRQVAYETLSRRERKSRHLAVADQLGGSFGDDGEEVSEVIASHLVDALEAVPEDPDVPELRGRAVAVLTRAGERTARTGAPVSAARAFASAARLLEPVGTTKSDLQAAALHERAGGAALVAGDHDRAAAEHGLAADLFRRHGRVRDAARVDVARARADRRRGRHEEAGARLEAARAVLEVDPDEDTVTALGELAALAAFAGRAAEADHFSNAALAEAQAQDVPPSVLADLFVIRGLSYVFTARTEEAAAYLREGARRADAAHDGGPAARAAVNLADVLLALDPDEAVAAARTARDHARRIGLRDFLAYADGNLILASLLSGAWDGAREAHATAVGEDGLGDHHAIRQCEAMLLALTGDLPALREVLDTVERVGSEDPQDRAGAEVCFALAAQAEGDHAEALRRAVVALDLAEGLGPHSDAMVWGWPLAADAAHALGDADEVRRLLERLDQHRPGHLPRLLRAERLRVRARLLGTEGDPAADEALAAAITALREFGSPYHLAGALLDRAEHQAATGDLDGAREGADEAAGLAQRLGAGPLRERALRLAERVLLPTT